MEPPSHNECLQSQENTDTRNKMYLEFIFDHSASRCNNAFTLAASSYSDAYDELVRQEGHGTSGSRIASRASVPPLVPLTSTSRSPGIRSESQRYRLARAEELVRSWKRQYEHTPVSDRQFWEEYWDYSYRGFRDAQREMGRLRDDISRGEFQEGISKYSLDYLKKRLNDMLLRSVQEWYLKWGELDLHRLSFRDAVEMIKKLLIQPPWREMRIVAGQRSHRGEDHHSEGVLYSLLHRIFRRPEEQRGEVEPELGSGQERSIRDCQRYIRENDVTFKFFSNGAAVHLKKKRKNRPRSVHVRPGMSGMLRR